MGGGGGVVVGGGVGWGGGVGVFMEEGGQNRISLVH